MINSCCAPTAGARQGRETVAVVFKVGFATFYVEFPTQVRADDGKQVTEHVLPALVKLHGDALASDVSTGRIASCFGFCATTGISIAARIASLIGFLHHGPGAGAELRAALQRAQESAAVRRPHRLGRQICG